MSFEIIFAVFVKTCRNCWVLNVFKIRILLGLLICLFHRNDESFVDETRGNLQTAKNGIFDGFCFSTFHEFEAGNIYMYIFLTKEKNI